MDPKFPIFDAHLHAGGLSAAAIRTMVSFGLRGALIPARDVSATATKEYVAHLERVAKLETRRLSRLGVKAFAALGVHPARIPWHGLEGILAAIPQLAGRGRLVAIGEIGLEKGGAREEQVLERQLALAVELNLPVVVGTPEQDKARRTRRVLQIVQRSGIDAERVLIAHASSETLRTILGCGHHAGLSVNPARLTAEAAVRLVQQFGSERLVFASAAGEGAGDILALARAAALLETRGLSAPVVRRVMAGNALAFFRLGKKALAL